MIQICLIYYAVTFFYAIFRNRNVIDTYQLPGFVWVIWFVFMSWSEPFRVGYETYVGIKAYFIMRKVNEPAAAQYTLAFIWHNLWNAE